MNHQERMELLGALSRSGVIHFKSLDLEIRFGGGAVNQVVPATTQTVSTLQTSPAPQQDEVKADKIQELIDTMKMDDESLLDKIFPAGA